MVSGLMVSADKTARWIPRPFNSPFEHGLRMLFVLDAARGESADIQRLISYDYLLVHSGDVPGGPESLHPAVPFRGSELLVKRDLLRSGLNEMHSRELLVKNFDNNGITYRATRLTTAFLALMHSSYALALKERAKWVTDTFQALDDRSFAEFISLNVGRWGAEFDRITAIDKLVLD